MEDIKRTDLDNGITVITDCLNEYESVSIGIWLEQGSRDEVARTNGVSHFFEHMVFKGTTDYSALDLVSKIEGKGGYLNAYTTRENTCFYAKVIHDDILEAVDILCQLVEKPTLNIDEFEKEKEVILEEIQGYYDQPDEWVYDILLKNIFPEHSLGYSIAGDVPTVEALKHQDLLDHWDTQLNEGRWVISAAGKVDHEELVEWVKERLTLKKSGKAKPRIAHKPQSKSELVGRDLNQSTVALGTVFENLSFKERVTLNFVHQMLGEGMSSRLFQNIREAHGLVYSIYTGVDTFDLQSLFTISLAADPVRMIKALDILKIEMAALKESGWREEEFEWAKGAVVGGMIMHRESTSSRMNSLTRRVMSTNADMTHAERVELVKSIKLEDVMRFTEMLVDAEWSGAMIHPNGKGFSLEPYLKF